MARSIPVRICLPTGLLIRPLGVGGSCLPSWVAFYWHYSSPPAWRDERLLAQAEGSELSQRIWALWGLGLLGNRGVEPERLTQVLVAQLQDSDPEVRHWAVEGLAYLGSDDTIAPLLQTLHDDASPVVRERAAI